MGDKMTAVSKDVKISNLKGILIFLVVFGHLIEIYKDDYFELFVFIYAFHMPLFIFISGYLAKRMRISKVVNFILLYLIFQTFFNWVLHLTGDYPNLQFTYGEPHFHLWYIVSMGFWYGIILIITKLNLNTAGKWITFIIIFIIGFMSRWYTDDVVDFVQKYYGNFSSYTLSYQRTLSFLPFFFLGYFMNKQWLSSIYHSLNHRITTIMLLIITMLFTFLYVQNADGFESIFRGSHGINKFLDDNDGFSMYFPKIIFSYALSFWLCYLIINLIPNKASIFTKWGDNSLTIFLFHPIIVFVIRSTEYMTEWEPDTKLIAFLLVTIIVTFILGSNFFERATRYMCNPYYFIKKVMNK
ncbi:acyltransferase family protein [Virgibacillus sp. NKC19-3]|uniref:acyltransferase family protein n=1 Tax=Virgibacillus saliphilus TaxID=2831674 RepID=UPI001C9B6BE7|nr:acyltransferase family protein [Virgibacillus sp. NKC19-3]MBY7144655.1 acyltransferase family protein [Virgibacillus sp. NKC19-3]